MSAIWSDEAKLQRWLDVELAALEGWAETGALPRAAVDSIRARAAPPTPERVAEIEAKTHHDVAAFVDAVAEARASAYAGCDRIRFDGMQYRRDIALDATATPG